MDEPDVVAINKIPTRDELVEILRGGYRSIIMEADEWRPIAQHVHDLCRACVKGAIEAAMERSLAAERLAESTMRFNKKLATAMHKGATNEADLCGFAFGAGVRCHLPKGHEGQHEGMGVIRCEEEPHDP